MTNEKKYQCFLCWIKDPILLAGLLLFIVITGITMTMINSKTNNTIDKSIEIENELNDVHTNLIIVKGIMEEHIAELKSSNGIAQQRIDSVNAHNSLKKD